VKDHFRIKNPGKKRYPVLKKGFNFDDGGNANVQEKDVDSVDGYKRLIATRDIEQHEEFLLPYHINDSEYNAVRQWWGFPAGLVYFDGNHDDRHSEGWFKAKVFKYDDEGGNVVVKYDDDDGYQENCVVLSRLLPASASVPSQGEAKSKLVEAAGNRRGTKRPWVPLESEQQGNSSEEAELGGEQRRNDGTVFTMKSETGNGGEGEETDEKAE